MWWTAWLSPKICNPLHFDGGETLVLKNKIWGRRMGEFIRPPTIPSMYLIWCEAEQYAKRGGGSRYQKKAVL